MKDIETLMKFLIDNPISYDTYVKVNIQNIANKPSISMILSYAGSKSSMLDVILLKKKNSDGKLRINQDTLNATDNAIVWNVEILKISLSNKNSCK